MSLDSLHDLYVDELKDLYNAENQLLKGLPKMAKAASAPHLKSAFEEHLEVTRGQVEWLEQIFEDLAPARREASAATLVKAALHHKLLHQQLLPALEQPIVNNETLS
jgi:ferritin-like metal-binding protein YciE